MPPSPAWQIKSFTLCSPLTSWIPACRGPLSSCSKNIKPHTSSQTPCASRHLCLVHVPPKCLLTSQISPKPDLLCRVLGPTEVQSIDTLPPQPLQKAAIRSQIIRKLPWIISDLCPTLAVGASPEKRAGLPHAGPGSGGGLFHSRTNPRAMGRSGQWGMGGSWQEDLSLRHHT